MKEGFRPNQTVQPEAKPQGSAERQPLPAILDVLERSVKAEAAHWAGWERNTSSENMRSGRKLAKEQRQLEEEFARLSTEARGRERLMVEAYTTLSSDVEGVYRFGSLGMDETRKLIARVAPMSEDELHEELRKAQEVREAKVQSYRRRQDTLRLYATLTPEEREQRRLENRREQVRRRYKERAEQGLFPPSKQKRKQVVTEPTQE
jgi:hypothetical protein